MGKETAGPEALKERLNTLSTRRNMRGDLTSLVGSQRFQDLLTAGLNPLPVTSGAEYQALVAAEGLADQAQRFADLTADLPDNFGTRVPPIDVRIALVADRFFHVSLEGVADVHELTPTNWRDLVGVSDVLLLTSTWHGLNEDWTGLGADTPQRALLLDEIVPAFRRQGVPVVFHSKEDPPSFASFLKLAQAADHVFTSAESCIPQYEKACPNAKSFGVMSFGVNPLHHTPVGSRRRRFSPVVFAGSWYSHKFQARREAGVRIFDGVLASGRELLILDRFSTLGIDRYAFPQQFVAHQAPGIPHDLLLKLQRITDVNINLNSVVGSHTMYANRVVELQAMGSHLLSNYNVGVNDRFPNVFCADSSVDVATHLDGLTPLELYRLQMAGLRNVYSHHMTHAHLSALLSQVGFAVDPWRPRVGVCGEAAAQLLERSTIPVKLASEDGTDCDVVVQVDRGFEFGVHVVEDLVNAFSYTDADFVTKSKSLAAEGVIGSDTEHDRVGEASPGATAVWVGSDAHRRWLATGRIEGSGYAIDPLELIPSRTIVGASARGDARWEPADAASPLTDTESLLSVIVPVYDNGRFLVDKCFSSLRRSSVFSRMEVLLVDDGSSDTETLAILESLTQDHANVRWLRNPVGGSGSAARPRNQGLRAASAPYVAWLDPDDEAVNDGYARLLDLIRSTGCDMVAGDLVVRTDRFSRMHYAVALRHYLRMHEDRSLVGGARGLTDMLFTPISVQCLVADTAWLRGLGLEQTVGAVGEDTFFVQQMLFHAARIHVLDDVVSLYNGAVSGSVVNSVSADFFAKYLPLERDRARWLREVGLLDDYRRIRHEHSIRVWQYPRFLQVPAEERDRALGILQAINEHYGMTEWTHPELQELFGGSLVEPEGRDEPVMAVARRLAGQRAKLRPSWHEHLTGDDT